jgi:hypothetical protein
MTPPETYCRACARFAVGPVMTPRWGEVWLCARAKCWKKAQRARKS